MERLITSPLGGFSSRRGVLLLLVLSLLTLFMMLGATYLVIASRARATARAFANAISGAQSIPTPAMGQAYVDDAFLRVVRGSASGSSGVIANVDTLLGDKYGVAASGTATSGTILANSTSGDIVITTTATVSGTDSVESLAGRVLTFTVPGLTNASVRILRAEPAAGNAKLFLPAGPTLSGVNLSAAAISVATAASKSSHFVINGREFAGGATASNEAWDGYDSNNDFLANPIANNGTALDRYSYKAQATTVAGGLSAMNAVDNDGDGVLDSPWIDVGLPPIVNAAGQTIYPRAAILITDLDGRLNVNAHGSRSEVDNPSSLYSGTFATGTNGLVNITSATSSFATLSLSQYPRGRGVGPAEIAIESSGLFESSSGDSGTLPMTGIDAIATGTDSRLMRTPPKVGAAEGRYGGAQITTSSGSFPRPGAPYTNDAVTALGQGWMCTSGTAYFTSPVRYGSPPDLKATTRIFLDDFGQPVFYRPYWAASASRAANIDDESIDDPYETNLSRLGPRTGAIVNAAARTTQGTSGYSSDYRASAPLVSDNLFTAADLEGLLRAYDIDSPKLSRRLPAFCGTKTGANRLLLTTDSWDTSAMTGTARNAVSTLIATSSTAAGMSVTAAMSMFAPETLMGHKLDLNRPFHTTNATEPNDTAGQAGRLAFAKHFYCLTFAIAGNGGALNPDANTAAAYARQLAQWAVNVVDFRDDDSVATGFEFDTNLTNGWNVDGDLTTTNDADRGVVWGCERPEILITETVCWHDRRTDDLLQGNNKLTTTNSQPDNDFDQQRRPQGGFFFELYVPWKSQLGEYGSTGLAAVRRMIQGGTSSLLRAEPAPTEFMSVTETSGTNALARFDAGGTVTLSGTTGGGFPVWRLVSLKRSSTSKPAITDPTSTVSGTTWRTFYFTKPPVTFVRTSTNGDFVSGTNAVAFWPSSGSGTIAPQTPTVFGTPGLLSLSSPFVGMDTMFLNPTTSTGTASTTRGATLTEPLITLGTNASYDPYAVLHAQSDTATTTFPLSGSGFNDRPLDDLNRPSVGIAQLLGADNNRTLIQNGRHANYFHVYLQRLANPSTDWDKNTNPYITVDSQPVDLVVYNTFASGTNYDEPCVTGSFSSLRTLQRNYDDADTLSLTGTSAQIAVERAKTQVSGTTDVNVWSASVNPNGSDDAYKLLSIDTTSYRTAAAILGSGNNQSLAEVPAPAKTAHTLGKLPTWLAASSTAAGTAAPRKPFPWLVWANRPFTSAAELSLVTHRSSFDFLRQQATALVTGTDAMSTGPFGHLPAFFEPTVVGSSTFAIASPWPAVVGRSATSGNATSASPSIWDAVHVPTQFGGSYQDVPLTTTGTAALSLLGLDQRPYGQFPHFREPGRININTITGTAVWTALLGSGTSGTTIQSWTPGTGPFDTPAKTLLEALGRYHPTVSGTTSFVDTYTEAPRHASSNAWFRYQTVNRLANLTTIRSNVFAVWVTIGYSTSPSAWTEAGSDTGDIRRHRRFYLFDRSIPVGFDPGKDLNVRDAILLRRIIQ